MTNTIGKIFSITSFGSSHGKALGAVVDGCPANLELSEEDIQIELNKRRPGTSALTTSRQEGDKIEIVSGIFEGKTDGTPITGIVYNTNQKSIIRNLRIIQTLKTLQDQDMEISAGWKGMEFTTTMEAVVEAVESL